MRVGFIRLVELGPSTTLVVRSEINQPSKVCDVPGPPWPLIESVSLPGSSLQWVGHLGTEGIAQNGTVLSLLMVVENQLQAARS